MLSVGTLEFRVIPVSTKYSFGTNGFNMYTAHITLCGTAMNMDTAIDNR